MSLHVAVIDVNEDRFDVVFDDDTVAIDDVCAAIGRTVEDTDDDLTLAYKVYNDDTLYVMPDALTAEVNVAEWQVRQLMLVRLHDDEHPKDHTPVPLAEAVPATEGTARPSAHDDAGANADEAPERVMPE